MYGPYGTRSALLARAERVRRGRGNWKRTADMHGGLDRRALPRVGGWLLWRLLLSIALALAIFASMSWLLASNRALMVLVTWMVLPVASLTVWTRLRRRSRSEAGSDRDIVAVARGDKPGAQRTQA
jgi:hypothetical protein